MRLLVQLRQSNRFKKILFYGILVSTFLYLFFIPVFGEKTNILRYSIYASMVILGILVFVYNLIYLDFKIAIPTLLIIAFTLFSLIGTSLYSHDYRKWFSLVLLMISFFIFTYAFRIIKKKELIVSIIAIAFFLFTLFFIIHYRSEIMNFKDVLKGKFRLGDYFDNPNGVAAYAVVGFSSALYCLLFIRKPIRFMFIAPILSNGLVGIATGSKSFVFACLLFAVVILYFVFKKHKLVYLLSVVALFGAFILLLQLPFMATIKERIIHAFLTIFGEAEKADTATIERAIWFDYGLFLGYRNGIFGFGVNGFSIYSGVGAYTHSNISEVLCDFGFIGFLLFYLPLVFLLLEAIFDKKVDKPLIIGFVTYYIFIGISNVYYYKKVYYMILALCFYISYFECVDKKQFFKNKDIKTIMLSCDSLSSGGAERVITTLANEFSIQNIEAYIVGVSDNGGVKPFYNLETNVKYIPLCESFNKRPTFIKRVHLIRKEINRINPDVVISFLPHVNFYITCALFGKGDICHIVSERSNPIVDPKGIFRKMAKRLSFDLADGCVFQSEGAKKAYPDPIQDKSSIILNPISVPSKLERSDKANNIFLNTGRLTKEKNHDLLIDAFIEFNNNHNNKYLLKIYGNGPLKDELIKKCNDKVMICEPNNNWLEIEKNACCFILSSTYEGLPNALMEALSVGMPSISSNCEIGGPEELHSRGFIFELFMSNDKADLIRCMERIIDNPTNIYKDNIKLANSYNAKAIANEWISYVKSI